MQTLNFNKKLVLLPLIVLTIVFSFSLATASAAAPVYVDAIHGSDSNTGTIDHPKKSIQSGVNKVSTDGTVIIANGVYSGQNNRNIYIKKSMKIQGTSRDDTIIDAGSQANMFNVISGVTLYISKLTLRDGHSSQGGGIYNTGNLKIDNTKFVTNTGNNGGAILSNRGTLKISKSSFTNNMAKTGFGGAIQIIHGSLSVSDSKFTSNIASKAGAILNDHSSLNVINSIFTGNKAINGHGGAIYNYYGPLSLNTCKFSDNIATSGGGAVHNGNSVLTIYKNSFLGNKAKTGSGGAISNSRGTLKISKSIFKYNVARKGIAIYNYYGKGNVNYSQISGLGNQIYNYNGSLDARYNWWGGNINPSGRVSIGVKVNPWLTHSITIVI